MLVATARHRLAGLAPAGGHPVGVTSDELDAVRQFCRTDRISGLLAGAVRAGEVVVRSDGDTASAIESIDDDWHAALHACVLLESLLVRVAARLDAVGVRWLVTKGPAVAHLDYPDAGLRTFADVDLVIHPDDWDAALDLLVVDRDARSRALDFTRRYGKGCTVLVDDMEIDLHLRFGIGRFGVRCRMEDCFERTDTILVAGRRLPTLTVEYRLLHACFHAALGGFGELRAFRDVAQLSLAAAAAPERTWEIARSWGVEAVVAAAVRETWRRLGLPIEHPVAQLADGFGSSRVDRRALAVFAREAPFRRQSLTTLSTLPLRGRPGFVLAGWRMSRERRR